MVLGCKTKSARGVGYSYWHLCETVRTARGPRQRAVATLGKLDQADVEGLRGGWDDLRSLLRGEPPPAKTAALPGLGAASAPPSDSRWERADVSGLRVERTRDLGESCLGIKLWHRLKLDELLASLLPQRESVAWAHTAALLTIARCCAQPSELSVAEHRYDTTALDDLLGIAKQSSNIPFLISDMGDIRATKQNGIHQVDHYPKTS